MAKLMNALLMKRLTLLQSFISLTIVTLLAVLALVSAEFAWAEHLRLHLGDPDWVLPALVAAVLLTVTAGIGAMAVLFYRLKLRRPLELLNQASNRITANDLDFRLSYDSRDEMGDLIAAFEHMRAQMETNVRTLWRSVEERKRLNAIFAHDLRTPLSVLKGNAELLAAYLPENRLSEEKVLESIRTMSIHIARLESYADAMSSIQKLEDMPVNRLPIEPTALTGMLNDTAGQLAERSGIQYRPSPVLARGAIRVDRNIVMQIFENLAANAIRYAVSQVHVRYDFQDGLMKITVSDDGPGFTEEALRKAMMPFYRGEERDAAEHRGIGLYVCKQLCVKHGGDLRVGNGPRGGGSVTASFVSGVDHSLIINR